MIQEIQSKLKLPKKMGFILFVLFIVNLVMQPAFSQSSFKAAEGSSVSISGTSTFHDWEMTSNKVESSAEFAKNESGKLSHVSSVDFSVRVKSLKSDKSKLDQNAYKALEAENFPEIQFQTISSNKLVRNNGDRIVRVKGKLTISDVTKEKTVEAVCTYRDENKMVCEGETQLKMTEFGVKPPTFMLGAMKTGDEITVSYKMIYISKNK